MSKQIQLTGDQIRLVLEAMHDICVYVGDEAELRVTCSLCDQHLFVGEITEDDEGNVNYGDDIGADALFILAGEHCLPDASGISECETLMTAGILVDAVATEHGLTLPD